MVYKSGKFISISDIAQHLEVSRMTVYRLIHAGEIPSIRVGRSLRVEMEQYRKWLSKQTKAAETIYKARVD